ncbi:7-aminocholesterol resistance protein RTA1 [Metarhizium brunneum]
MADDKDVWMYNPSFALAVIGTIVYGLIFIAITYLTFFRYRAWYFTVVVIGAAVEVAGYVLRAYSARNRTILVPFVLTLTFTVLAPVFVAAGNYLLISRLIRAVLPPSHHRVLGVPGNRLTPIFVVCDVVSFFIQGSGSGIASSDNWQGEKEKIGRYVLIGGLSFQLVAFGLFLCVFRRFHVLANRMARPEAPTGWQQVVLSVYISSVLIMVRCIYRVCEFAEGMNGYAFRTEWLFWVFETLPMIGAIGIFVIYHPGRFLGQDGAAQPKEPRSDESMELAGKRRWFRMRSVNGSPA